MTYVDCMYKMMEQSEQEKNIGLYWYGRNSYLFGMTYHLKLIF